MVLGHETAHIYRDLEVGAENPSLRQLRQAQEAVQGLMILFEEADPRCIHDISKLMDLCSMDDLYQINEYLKIIRAAEPKYDLVQICAEYPNQQELVSNLLAVQLEIVKKLLNFF